MSRRWTVSLTLIFTFALAACEQAPSDDPSSVAPTPVPSGGLVPGASPTPSGGTGGGASPTPTPGGGTAGEPILSGKTIVKISPARVSGSATTVGLEGNVTTTYHATKGTTVGLDLTFSGTAAKQTP